MYYFLLKRPGCALWNDTERAQRFFRESTSYSQSPALPTPTRTLWTFFPTTSYCFSYDVGARPAGSLVALLYTHIHLSASFLKTDTQSYTPF